MNVSGKCNVFVREVGTKKIKIFEASFSRKDKDGNYVDNVSCRLEFGKDLLPDEKKGAFHAGYYYPMEIEGFLTTRGWENSEGKHRSEIAIHVTNAKTCDKPQQFKVVEKKEVIEEETILGPDGNPLPF